MATTSHHFSKILIHISHAKEGKRGGKYCGFCCCAAEFAGMSRPSDPKKWKDVDVSKGTRLLLEDLSCSLAGRIQKCLLFFSIQRRNSKKKCVLLQNQTQSVAVMSVSTSECPDDPEGKLWQSIAMEVSINGAQ